MLRTLRVMHPIMVWVLIISVTIVFSILVANYLLSVWQTQQATFMVSPLLYVRGSALGSNLVLELFVSNEGQRSAKILGVEIIVGGGKYVNNTIWVIRGGERKVIKISDWIVSGNPSRIVPGERYRVLVYVEEYGVYMYDVVAQ